MAIDTALTQWLPYVEPDVPGAPAPAIVRAVRDAAIQFCRETKIWWEVLPAQDLTIDVHTYTLNPPAKSVVAELTRLTVEGAPIYPTTVDWLASYKGKWEEATGARPSQYFRPTPTTFRIYPTATETVVNAFLATAVLRPADDATGVEAMLFEEFREAISDGTKARLFRQKAAPWYDPLEAESRNRSFLTAIVEAKWRAVKGDVSQMLVAETGTIGMGY